MDSLDSLMIRVDALVTTLVMGSLDVQKETIHMLRLLSKIDDDHRACIGDAGAIPHFLKLLSSTDPEIQEDAITCLLNASIVDSNKRKIMGTRGAIDKIVAVLRTGARPETRQNAATTLFSIMIVDEYRNVIGQKEAVILALLQLLQEEAPRSKKDALKALFHLSLSPDNKSRIIQRGTLHILLDIVEHRVRRKNNQNSHSQEMENPVADAMALLTQLASCSEGVAVLKEQRIMTLLVELLEPGESSRCREHAAAALLTLCQTGGQEIIQELLRYDNCVSALCGLLSAGSQRAKAKAGALLQLLVVNERS